MTTNFKIILGIIVVILLGLFVYSQNRDNTDLVDEQVVTETDSISGCYVKELDKDVYTLRIDSQNGENFSGHLSFKNFQKDSSSGTYEGTYKDGILLGTYSFASEGMDSKMQVIFKKEGNTFVRGIGDMDEATGTQFTDLSNVTYDPSQTFTLSENCGQVGKLPAGSSPVPSATSIQGINWVWKETLLNDGTKITPKKAGAFTLKMESDGKMAGKTDCNSYFGSYQVGSDGVITFSDIGMTKMFCEGSQEMEFTKFVTDSNQYMVNTNGELVLMLPFDSGSVIFTR